MDRHLLYLFLFVLAGCSKGEKRSPNVFFAGEIVNPTSNHIVLYKDDMVIDSALLDERNRFSFSFDSIAQGLYHFYHDPELQYVYLEQGDSLMIRLNTMDFDESLIFSGTGEEINNFLIDFYLANEKEERALYTTYYGMEPQEFSVIIDSLRHEKLKGLSILGSEVTLSEEAYEMAEASINYTYFNYKELYPFKHRRNKREMKVHELSDDFYTFRKDVSYSNEHLNYLRPYYDFMRSHFGNLAYMSCSQKCEKKGEVVKNQLHFNKHKLKLIDSLVIEQELKDNLFRNVAFEYLLEVNDTQENNQVFIDVFHKLSHNNRHIAEIDNLYAGIENLQPNKTIPNIPVVDSSGNDVSLREIAKGGKTVFYFWSGTNKRHFDNIMKRVSKLSTKKPEYKFVGINIKTSENAWKQLLETTELDKRHQFWVHDFEQFTNALIINKLNKCVITDDMLIVDAFSDIYASF